MTSEVSTFLNLRVGRVEFISCYRGTQKRYAGQYYRFNGRIVSPYELQVRKYWSTIEIFGAILKAYYPMPVSDLLPDKNPLLELCNNQSYDIWAGAKIKIPINS